VASTFLSLDDDAALFSDAAADAVAATAAAAAASLLDRRPTFLFAAALAEGVFFADGLSADTSRKKCLELSERL